MHKRTCLPVVMVLLAVAALGAAGQSADDEPLARVDQHVITRGELDRFLGLQQPVAGLEAVLPEAEQIEQHRRRQALEALVERHLLVQEARARYINTDTDEQILEAFGRRELERLEQDLGSRLRMWQVLFERGLTAEHYRQMRIESLLIGKLLNEEV
ncbi:MAG: SurA N-terminal domain-containing protein, partial [Candidatus Brocadiia bacterium]